MEVRHVKPRPDRLHIKGRIDSTFAADGIKQAAQPIIDCGRYLITLDMAELEYIASPGLRALIELRKKLIDLDVNHGVPGDLIVANMPPRIKEVFDLTGFSGIFTFENDAQGVVVFSTDQSPKAD